MVSYCISNACMFLDNNVICYVRLVLGIRTKNIFKYIEIRLHGNKLIVFENKATYSYLEFWINSRFCS